MAPAHDTVLMDSIESAYLRRFPQFHRAATAIVGDRELGRDAVQEAFARAISRRSAYRGDGPLDAWLWRTVTNVACDQRRAAGAAIPHGELPDVADAGARFEHDLEPTLRALVAELPERQRLALFLRYYADMSYTEIGEALQIRVGTVSATLNAAHKALRQTLN